jgi:hypothetical protein
MSGSWGWGFAGLAPEHRAQRLLATKLSNQAFWCDTESMKVARWSALAPSLNDSVGAPPTRLC